MHTSSGTRACDASITAGWKLAAAVPDVHSSTAGRPLARPRPSARNAAERSSSTTCTRIRSSRASARASGAERDPGAITASVTPARAHSSTNADANAVVASRSLIGATPRRGRRRVRMGTCPARVSCSFPASRRPRRRGRPSPTSCASRAPSARSTCRRPRPSRPRPRRIGEAGGGRDLRRLLDGRAPVPAARARPARPRARARARRARRPASPTPTSAPRASSRRAARRERGARRCGHVPRALARATDVRERPRRRARAVADRRRLTPEFLAACLRHLGAGAMEPMWERAGRARDAGAARDRQGRPEVRRRSRGACSNACTRAWPTCSSTAGTRSRSSNRRCSAA